MNSYLTSIITACTLFPLVAAVFTMPFVIVHYRKYGGIPVIRVMVVYSFILYSMCALFLTVLPLPSINAVEAMKPKPVGLIPGKDLYQTLIDAGFSFKDLSTFGNFRCWKIMFGSFGFFQIVANIIMQVPLGIYLRYYFRLDWKKTLLAGYLLYILFPYSLIVLVEGKVISLPQDNSYGLKPPVLFMSSTILAILKSPYFREHISGRNLQLT